MPSAKRGVRRDQTDAQREATFLRVRAAVYALYQQLLASQGEPCNCARTHCHKHNRLSIKLNTATSEGGSPYLELATAQQELLELRLTLIEAAADYHRVLAEIERLTGEPLATTVTSQELP